MEKEQSNWEKSKNLCRQCYKCQDKLREIEKWAKQGSNDADDDIRFGIDHAKEELLKILGK